MIEFVAILTFLLITSSLVFAARELVQGSRSCVLIIFPIHFLFCGLPLLLDVVIGVPSYQAFPGFHIAAHDETTTLVYCAYMVFCLGIWWMGYVPRRRQRDQLLPRHALRVRDQLSPARQFAVCALLLLPFVLVALAPDPWMYAEYTSHDRELYFRDAERHYHMWVSRAIQASLLASAILLFFSRKLLPSLTSLIPIVGADCWLSGKRNAIATVLVLWIYSLWRRGALQGKQLITACVIGGVGLLAFSGYYQTQLRFSDQFVENKTSEFWYNNYRIDYGREDTIKLNIYALLHPNEMQILDYRGQSLEIIATMWVPRRFWPNKPPSYSHFVTTAAMGIARDVGGGVTTTWLCEAIANFGWFGFLIGPLLILVVCRVGDAASSETVHFLTLLVAVGLQTVHIAPWAVPAAAWFVLSMREILSLQLPARRPAVGRVSRQTLTTSRRPLSANPRPWLRPAASRANMRRPIRVSQPRPLRKPVGDRASSAPISDK
jgi:hypothetical protein